MYTHLAALVAAEAAAYAVPGSGIEAADVEQAVWVALLELRAAPPEPAAWVAAAVRGAALDADVRRRCERPYADPPAGPPPRAGQDGQAVEGPVLAADDRRPLLAAVRRLPGDCPRVVAALMSGSDLSYREISRELGISQGSLGRLRSRCLDCLRSILNSRVGSPVGRGNAR